MISGEWASIIPWSTENPNLYVAKLELKNPEGKSYKPEKHALVSVP